MRVEELWRESYQGEVLGEAVFRLLAERTEDADRRHQLETLALLERSTKDLAEPVMERHGYARGDVNSLVASITANIERTAAAPWEDMVRGTIPIADTYIMKYRELVELVDNDADRAVAEAYVAHELALVSWARRALGEEAGEPLEPVLSLPHVTAAIDATFLG
jgi:hypothetical protein